MTNTDSLLEWARTSMSVEAHAISEAAVRLGDSFEQALEYILKASGKVVTTGLGKSGHVARKIAATLASTGTPSFYLHPGEALHGDLGMIQSQDVLFAIAYSGETAEVNQVCQFAKRIGVPVLSITGNPSSTLARLADCALDGRITKEVCPLNLAPTASTAVALALGDAVSVAVMKARGFNIEQFAKLHPGGSLGRSLKLVGDLMHARDHIPSVRLGDSLVDVLSSMTKRNFGITPVLNDAGDLAGSISDGDIRRALLKSGKNSLELKAKDFMTPNPKWIEPKAFAVMALRLMEQHQITSLFVKSSDKDTYIGLIRMHDLLSAKVM